MLPRMLTLPAELEESIAEALRGTPSARWIAAAQALSERYRAARTHDDEPLAAGDVQALGYAAMMMPATYAQLHGALEATAARAGDWAPRSVLDLGSGPGTALWAVVQRWPEVERCVAWEAQPAFIALGRRLAGRAASPALREARWERTDLRRLTSRPGPTFDLVILGHVLNELAPADAQAVAQLAWEMTSGVLLIVEPGTSAAFAVVRTARDALLAAGAHTLAPCAHDRPCPLVDDWCHFPQRLKRPEFQRRARGAPSDWEEAKFSYASMARFPAASPIWGRVIREGTSNKAYAETKISARPGVSRYRALKRHKDAFRLVKSLEWGDAMPEPPPAEAKAIDAPPTEDGPGETAPG